MRNLLLSTAILALSASPAVSGEERAAPTLGIEAGAALPFGDINDALDPSYRFGAYFTMPIRGILAARVEGSYDRFTLDSATKAALCTPGANCDQPYYLHGGAGLQLQGQLGRRGFPYLNGTVGAYRFDLGDANETDLGVAFAAGIDGLLGDTFGVGAEVKVHAVFGDETEWYLTPGGHLFFRF